MKIIDTQDIEANLNSQLDNLSRAETIKILKEAIAHADDLENNSKLLVTHLKVLCHKSGGEMTYTKEEYDAAAKDDFAFTAEYGVENNKQVCIMKLAPRDDSQKIQFMPHP